jgi:hypothetical protein
MLRAMKALSVAAFLLASVALALTPAVSMIYREAYPIEPVKRAALAACAEADRGFDRLIAGQRAQCYARRLQAPETPEAVPPSEQLARTES